jgi:hypothetical protein
MPSRGGAYCAHLRWLVAPHCLYYRAHCTNALNPVGDVGADEADPA